MSLPPEPTGPTPDASAEASPGAGVARAVIVAGVVVAVWLLTSVIALRVAGPYPPRITRPALLIGGVVFGVFAFLFARYWTWWGVAVIGVALALLVPAATLTWAPGLAPAREYPLSSGATVVAAAAPDAQWDLYLTPEGDPSRRIRLTDTTDVERYPHLSPDDSIVSYALEQPDGTYDIAIMRLGEDGQPLASRVVIDRPGSLTDQAWAPDGVHLLVSSTDAKGRASIYRYDRETGAKAPWARNAWNPSYSPDGRQVAVASRASNSASDTDIYVMDADGSGRRRVLGTPANDWGPMWSPDGGSIAFTTESHGDRDVIVGPADGLGELVNLTAGSPDQDEAYQWTGRNELVILSDRSHTGGVFMYSVSPSTGETTLFQRL